MKQGTREWHEARAGKFTASQIYRLMGKQGIGKTGETYVLEKVTEMMGVTMPQISNFAMEWGTETEPIAREYFEIAKNVKVEQAGFIEAMWNDQAGCSPDGLTADYGIEIKCPYNPVHHTENLRMKTAEDIKKNRKEYYWQCMFSMAVTGLKEWKFISFHPEFTGAYRMMIIPVKWNNEEIEMIKSRVADAVKLRNEIVRSI